MNTDFKNTSNLQVLPLREVEDKSKKTKKKYTPKPTQNTFLMFSCRGNGHGQDCSNIQYVIK